MERLENSREERVFRIVKPVDSVQKRKMNEFTALINEVGNEGFFNLFCSYVD